MPRRWSTIIAILTIEVLVLILRAGWEMHLAAGGYGREIAADRSYLIVPPLLVVLLAPVLREHRTLLERLFDPRRIAPGAVLIGLAIGVLSRLAWWCSVILRAAVGTDGVRAAGTFESSWNCPDPAPLLLAVLVWLCLVPLVEETLGRGLIQSLLEHRGRRFAIAASAVAFAVLHPPAAMMTALIMGVILACLRANSGSLWPAITAHGAYDGLGIADWRCLHAHWSPDTSGGPLFALAIPALIAFTLCAVAIAALIVRIKPEPQKAVRVTASSQGGGHPLDHV